MAITDDVPSWGTGPINPAKVAAQQQDMMRRLSMYQARQTRASKFAPVLDESQRFKDTRVQAMVSLDGELPTAMGQRLDRSIANNNTLRFVRKPAPPGLCMPSDGGRLYSSTTLDSNWVEERRDREHKSGWHGKELRRNKLWESEMTASYTVHDPQYAQKLTKRGLVAPLGAAIQVAKGLGPGSSDSLFHYGKDGFGEGPHQDHTSVEKRGGSWVGIAPIRGGKESVTYTVHGTKEYLEFQKRTPTTDAKAKFLGTQPGGRTHQAPDPWRTKAHEELLASERHTPSWVSMYQRDFQDFSRDRGNRLCMSSQAPRRPAGTGLFTLEQRPVTSGKPF